jgi:hypothetical protein
MMTKMNQRAMWFVLLALLGQAFGADRDEQYYSMGGNNG